MLVTLTQLLAPAEDGGYAVGAFNCSDLNQAYAVMQAARAERSPVIIQVIAGLSAYQDEIWWWTRLRELMLSYPDVRCALHLDHGRSFQDCMRAIAHGFTSVMIDGSRDQDTDEPASLADNIALTSRVVDVAHAAGVSVEGELGTVGGAETGQGTRPEDLVLADPGQAAEFVARTGVDALAVAVSTSHGSVKFVDPAGRQSLRIELIEQIKKVLPDTFLVLHGSSSIPAEAVQTINANGGCLPESFGVSVQQKQRGIATGIRKINQGTDSHLVWTAALRHFLVAAAATVEPSAPLYDAMTAMRELTALRMREFGSSGQG